MLFNSFVFPVFFLVVWGLYLCLKHRPQNVMLLFASYFFYGWWDWRFLSLLFISTITDFWVAKWMEKCGPEQARKKKGLLILSLTTSLGILGFFKYFNFFAESFERILTPLGFQPDFVTLNILLPVGISFYTFQTMAYTIDVYRGKDKVCRDFIDFSLYVAYFPALVAGPIERSTNLIPQIQKRRTLNPALVQSAVQLIFWGYFKKVFIADGVAPFVNECFTDPTAYGGKTLLFGAYLFAFQIYGDFSGYTDIARGISRLFGIELCVNFRQPYFATSITDFWRRWHISLSTWLRDYLYIPLGGNRKGAARTKINNMTTMLLGGLWHGAAWTFVFWGGLHGLYLAVHKTMLGNKKPDDIPSPKTVLQHLRRLFAIVTTFHLVVFAWIFFRAPSFSTAVSYINGILHFQGHKVSGLGTTLFFYGLTLLLLDGLCEIQKSEVPFVGNRFSPVFRGLVYAIALFLMFFVGGDLAQPFIYFQF